MNASDPLIIPAYRNDSKYIVGFFVNSVEETGNHMPRQFPISPRHCLPIARLRRDRRRRGTSWVPRLLSSDTADRVYFFVRSGWNGQGGKRINTPCSIHADGTGLTMHQQHIGGHPEWAEDSLVIGRQSDKQILYEQLAF